LESIAAIFDRVIGAEQPALDVLRLIQKVPASYSMVADSKLAAHPLNHSIQVVAGCNVWKKAGVLLLHRVPIGAVHIRRIEIVAIDAPGLIEDLGPLRR